MSWRDELRPASWRGVPFLVQTVEGQSGRRVVLHEYPGRDLADWEDLGKMPKRFTVEAFFVGETYHLSRDRILYEINEKAGPGILILPTMGQTNCICREPKLQWSNKDGGVEYLTLSFAQVGALSAARPVNDPASQLTAATTQAQTPVANSVVKAVSVTGQPSFVQSQTLSRSSALLGKVKTGFARVQLATSTVRMVAGRIQAIEQKALTLLATPAIYARQWLGLFTGLGNGLGSGLDGVRGLFQTYMTLFDAFGSDDGGMGGVTTAQAPARMALNQNIKALDRLAQTSVLIAAAELLPDIEWPSRTDAIADRDVWMARADALVTALGESYQDEWLQALSPVRGQANRVITEAARTLQDYRTIVLKRTVPSVVLAYELYEDAFRADEIVAENAVAHPGFLPMQKPLRVLDS